MLKKKKERSAEIPTGSLADIAFLLLIFFLVTTTIDTDKGLSLTLPDKGQETKVRSQNITNILINASGQVMLDENQVQVNEVSRRVRELLAQNPNMIFSVKTVRDTKYDIYIDVLDELKKANATRISIAEPEQ
ncbi:MAG: biopolymer transporter ExbD [candidate division KSB1 bacterium]|nr:biopolymer transporter ExbD [candidate division KSB1 bacterium]